GEAVFPNRYASWTPRLLRAAYNYQFLAKDPGAFAHNPRYATQITYDSLEDLSQKVDIDMGGMTRP
ncbi:MAG: polyheme membrane-associated cytochrome C, partial [Rhodobacteraceae bacterium]|nr:polyheme membrane-associated cytochrome C [Paracoccaceae bacterium]